MDATQEQWRPVVGYEGSYEVSSLGRVRSLDRVQHMSNGHVRSWRGRIMKQSLTTTGYMRVNLTTRNTCEQKVRKVHVLMLESFSGPKPFPSALGRHLNDVRTDNRIENLAWGSYRDNAQDMVRNGTQHNIRKTHCKRGHEFTPENTGPNTGGNRSCRACSRSREQQKRTRMQTA